MWSWISSHHQRAHSSCPISWISFLGRAGVVTNSGWGVLHGSKCNVPGVDGQLLYLSGVVWQRPSIVKTENVRLPEPKIQWHFCLYLSSFLLTHANLDTEMSSNAHLEIVCFHKVPHRAKAVSVALRKTQPKLTSVTILYKDVLICSFPRCYRGLGKHILLPGEEAGYFLCRVIFHVRYHYSHCVLVMKNAMPSPSIIITLSLFLFYVGYICRFLYIFLMSFLTRSLSSRFISLGKPVPHSYLYI